MTVELPNKLALYGSEQAATFASVIALDNKVFQAVQGAIRSDDDPGTIDLVGLAQEIDAGEVGSLIEAITAYELQYGSYSGAHSSKEVDALGTIRALLESQQRGPTLDGLTSTFGRADLPAFVDKAVKALGSVGLNMVSFSAGTPEIPPDYANLYGLVNALGSELIVAGSWQHALQGEDGVVYLLDSNLWEDMHSGRKDIALAVRDGGGTPEARIIQGAAAERLADRAVAAFQQG